MKFNFRNLLASSLIALGSLWAISPVLAQSASDPAQGEIRKIDKDAKKITIKHGEIKSVEMPPMTMVFQVKDAALLDNFKAGDKVRFRVVKEGSLYVVTEIIAE
jgi:Cu(I)/Ag(I) efflux system periplasmic protein CusF